MVTDAPSTVPQMRDSGQNGEVATSLHHCLDQAGCSLWGPQWQACGIDGRGVGTTTAGAWGRQRGCGDNGGGGVGTTAAGAWGQRQQGCGDNGGGGVGSTAAGLWRRRRACGFDGGGVGSTPGSRDRRRGRGVWPRACGVDAEWDRRRARGVDDWRRSSRGVCGVALQNCSAVPRSCDRGSIYLTVGESYVLLLGKL
ncbi:hypothetical protein K439DRAFT_1624654 [Ramaria rubella]|nr:hypothetical protein K439DRAFT_1624654 [Ramaria rubella]